MKYSEYKKQEDILYDKYRSDLEKIREKYLKENCQFEIGQFVYYKKTIIKIIIRSFCGGIF